MALFRARLNLCLALLVLLAWFGYPPPSLVRAQDAGPLANVVSELAAGQTPPDDALVSFAKAVLDAAHSPHKSLLIALLLLGTVFAVRRWGVSAAKALGYRDVATVLSSDRAGPVTVLLLSGLGAISAALMAGQPLTWPLVAAAFGIALKSIGGFVGARKVLGISSAPSPVVAPLPLP